MSLADTSIRSKFSKRIFRLFVLSAVLPVIVMAALSLDHVSKQLIDQSREQSRQASKAIGMELFERLNISASRLEMVADALATTSKTESFDPATINERLIQQFDAVIFVNDKEQTTLLSGKIFPSPVLSASQQNHLARGNSIVSTIVNASGGNDILIARYIDRNTPDNGVLLAKIRQDYLWGVRRILSNTTEMAVIDISKSALYQSSPNHTSTELPFDVNELTSTSGHFDWTHKNGKYLAGYWSLFTDSGFAMDDWTIVVSQPEREALSALVAFKTIYIPLLLITILLVSYFASNRIRKKLTPLVELRDATQRIAAGDFNTLVTVNGDDELGELGTAFGIMAGKLEKQFSSLSTMAEIDRLILSSFDARFIIATVLDRVAEITPCCISGILQLDKENQQSGVLSAVGINNNEELTEIHVHLSEKEITELKNNPDGIVREYSDGLPSYIRPLENAQTTSWLLIPLLIKQKLVAVIALGYPAEIKINKDEKIRLRSFSDHIAVALSNASWEDKLYHQAHYDTLTDLPNRALLKDRLEQAIARAERSNDCVGVVFIDLDQFKRVNDSLGHSTGDLLLQRTADILKKNVRSIDTVVRFGGDEFVIIIPDIDHHKDTASELITIVEKLLTLGKAGVSLKNTHVSAEMSIGIAVYPNDGGSVDELLRNADSAMYHAKDEGKGCYRFYSSELNANTLHRLQMEQELKRAIKNHEFELFYQGKVDGKTAELIATEALIRWNHPKRGLVPPFEFIPVLEETGLINEVGDWVLQTACKQIKRWADTDLRPIRVAVNVSPVQFSADFVSKVERVLSDTGVDPSSLELEVTEGMVMENTGKSIEILQQLHDIGVHLAIDDFGTGFSSLSYLRLLPVDTLKIDQSFVSEISDDSKSQAIVSSTIVLAHRLGLEVVAEGVETKGQYGLLRKWGCDQIQGYYFFKPIPVEQFTKELELVVVS